MPVIAARRYHGGCAEPAPLDVNGTPREPLPKGTFDWVGIADPTAEEMATVARQFGLHPLAVEDALNPRQLPKLDPYGQQLFVVARTAAFGANETIEYGQTAVFLGADFVVTVRVGSTRAHVDLRRDLELNAERLAEGPDYVLHAVLDFVVDGFIPMMAELEDVVHAMEEAAVAQFPEQDTIRRIFHLRRELRRFERIIGPMEALCRRLAEVDTPAIDPSARPWFRDVLDHQRQVMVRTAGLKDALSAVVETASLLEQHRLGEMTRRLGAWAALLAVPTAIAGIYGMNFQNMPELKTQYGYFIVLGAIFTICGVLFWRFRRAGWL